VVSSTINVTSGSVIDLGARKLQVVTKGILRGSGGSVTVLAREIVIESGGEIESRGSASSPGGRIECNAATIRVAGTLDTDGAPAGTVVLTSDGALEVSGTIEAKSLSAASDGGKVTLTSGTISVSGTVSATGGNAAFGGSVTLVAEGDVTVSGEVDVSGGDGGDISVATGSGAGAQGNVSIATTGSLVANATAAGGFGGEVYVSAEGNTVNTGDIIFRGSVEATGKSGTQDTGGGDGGVVSFEADGDVVNDSAAGGVDVSGGSPDGAGGEIDLIADAGTVVVTARLRVRSTGGETSGGEVSMDAAGPVVLNGAIDAIGGGFDGGSVDIESTTGDVTLGSTGSIDVSSTSGGGFGGEVALVAGAAREPGSSRLLINGPITGNGSGSVYFPGDGGQIDLQADAGMNVAAVVRASGASGGGYGGELTTTVLAGETSISANVTLTGNGVGGAGGLIDIDAIGSVTIGAQVDARGQNGASGGVFRLRADGPVDVGDHVLASGSIKGNGGAIRVTSSEDVTVNATLDASAGAQGSAGGKVTVAGCAVDITAGGSMENSGGQSTNYMEGRGQIRVDGDMLADTTTGVNEIHFRSGFVPQLNGNIEPAARLVADPALLPCGVATPTRTSTPGPATRTPTITRTSTRGPSPTITPTPTTTPTSEPVICTGDCNGSETVTIDELVRGVNIALGITGVEQCSAFDANNDGRVTIDELVSAVNGALSGCPASQQTGS